MITDRIKDEQNARYFYESAAAWCRLNGYDKAAAYFTAQSTEENEHYKGWVDFLSDWEVKITFPSIVAPVSTFVSLMDILEKQYEMEYALCEAYEADAANVFGISQGVYEKIQGYVKIQFDSVAEVNTLINKAQRYIGIDPNLVLFENEVF